MMVKSLLPKYQHLAQVLREEIVSGKLPANAQLPTEEMLIKQYGFSRETVRKAIGQLEAEGIVRREQGSGSFVNAVHPDAVAFHFTEPLVGQDNLRADITYRVLQQEVLPATLDYASVLKIAPGTPVIHLKQLKLDHGIIVSYSERHLPRSLCPGLAVTDLSHCSVHDILVGSAELPPIRAVVEIEARNLDKVEAQRLDVVPGTQAIIVNRLSYTAPNQPAVWYKGLFKNRYVMGVELDASSF